MTEAQVAVELRECREPHAVIRHVLVPAEDADRFVDEWARLGSTRAGRTEVVTHPVHHPQRIEQDQ